MTKDNAELRQMIEAGFTQMNARLDRIELGQAEMRGELRGLSSWLSSMDQRFVAIMRPYEPPQRSPAE